MAFKNSFANLQNVKTILTKLALRSEKQNRNLTYVPITLTNELYNEMICRQ